ncbi:hypothetical protein BGLA2_210033 [Burkholderia gladioli]|nr:hypothetical protein BGLA2_210033 [Burkholderia gladioli]
MVPIAGTAAALPGLKRNDRFKRHNRETQARC